LQTKLYLQTFIRNQEGTRTIKHNKVQNEEEEEEEGK